MPTTWASRRVVGTQMPLTVPKAVQDRLRAAGKDPTRPEVVRSLYEGMFRRISKAFPLDYYWLWTDEGWTWGNPKPEVVESITRDLRLAHEAIDNVKAPFVLGTCGWVLGPPGDREAFRQAAAENVAAELHQSERGPCPGGAGVCEGSRSAALGHSLAGERSGHDHPAALGRPHAIRRRRRPPLRLHGTVRHPLAHQGDRAEHRRAGPSGLVAAVGRPAPRPRLRDHRAAPIDDFYRDWATAHFGAAAGDPNRRRVPENRRPRPARTGHLGQRTGHRRTSTTNRGSRNANSTPSSTSWNRSAAR